MRKMCINGPLVNCAVDINNNNVNWNFLLPDREARHRIANGTPVPVYIRYKVKETWLEFDQEVFPPPGRF